MGGLVGNMCHHVKNSKYMVEELAKVVIDEENILNSHDVVSLFTNTPIDQVLPGGVADCETDMGN